MANDGTQGSGNGLLYGVIGALCVVVAGGGFYIYQSSQTPKLAPETAQAPVPAPATPAPPVQVAPRPAPPPAPAGPSASQLGQARAAIADARRLAARGNFGDAETALQNADKVVPGFAETAMARREIADMRTARGQTGRPDNRQDSRQDNRLAALLATAQAAIARHDYAAADRALDEAERIDARDPAVVQTRNELLEAAARGGRPSNRN
ncbi:MAG TPA: hypothetical protein VI232_03755 [Reyranella sp.]